LAARRRINSEIELWRKKWSWGPEGDAECRAKLAELKKEKIAVDLAAKLVMTEARETERVLQDKLLEYRASQAPFNRQEEGRRLLLEERQMLLAASEGASPSSPSRWNKIGRFHQIRINITRAEEKGDVVAVEALKAKLEPAQIEAEAAQAAMAAHREKIAAIRAEYEQRLAALSE
jgi:hypothetical protein